MTPERIAELRDIVIHLRGVGLIAEGHAADLLLLLLDECEKTMAGATVTGGADPNMSAAGSSPVPGPSPELKQVVDHIVSEADERGFLWLENECQDCPTCLEFIKSLRSRLSATPAPPKAELDEYVRVVGEQQSQIETIKAEVERLKEHLEEAGRTAANWHRNAKKAEAAIESWKGDEVIWKETEKQLLAEVEIHKDIAEQCRKNEEFLNGKLEKAEAELATARGYLNNPDVYAERDGLKAEVERLKDELAKVTKLWSTAETDATHLYARMMKAEAELARYKRFDKLIEAAEKAPVEDLESCINFNGQDLHPGPALDIIRACAEFRKGEK